MAQESHRLCTSACSMEMSNMLWNIWSGTKPPLDSWIPPLQGRHLRGANTLWLCVSSTENYRDVCLSELQSCVCLRTAELCVCVCAPELCLSIWTPGLCVHLRAPELCLSVWAPELCLSEAPELCLSPLTTNRDECNELKCRFYCEWDELHLGRACIKHFKNQCKSLQNHPKALGIKGGGEEMWEVFAIELKVAEIETRSLCSLCVGKEKLFKLQQEGFVLSTQEAFLGGRIDP